MPSLTVDRPRRTWLLNGTAKMLTELDVLGHRARVVERVRAAGIEKRVRRRDVKHPARQVVEDPPFTRTWPSLQAADPELSIVPRQRLGAVPAIVIAAPDATIVLPSPTSSRRSS